jgi:hypothetical protein
MDINKVVENLYHGGKWRVVHNNGVAKEMNVMMCLKRMHIINYCNVKILRIYEKLRAIDLERKRYFDGILRTETPQTEIK